MTIGIVDVIVLLASIAVVLWIGIRTGKGNQTADDYMFGGRNLPWWAILGSIVATETSTATVLSIPGFGFGPVGLKFLQLAMGYIVGRLLVVTILLPLFFKGQLSSAYHVLRDRFGQRSTHAASLLFLVTRNLGDGLRLFLAALVLNKLLGWDFYLCALTTGAITMLYTYVGGMRSVVWNDCIQLLIYMSGGLATIILLTMKIDGGWATILEFAQQNNKLQVIQAVPAAGQGWLQWLLTSPYTIWVGVLGGATLTLGTHGTDQMMIQRYLSARSQTDAGKAVVISSLVVFIQFAIFLFVGIQLACFYQQSEPALQFAKPDEVYVHFLVNHFPYNTGMTGLMLAAILAAAMSTLSSSLNSSATAVINDFYLPACKAVPSHRKLLLITQVLTLLFGVVQVTVGILAARLSEQVVSSALAIAGYSSGLLLGMFFLGIATRRVGQTEALVGAVFGLCVLLLVQFVMPIMAGQEWKIAWPWYSLIGASATILFAIALSYVVPNSKQSDSTV
ncbi:MAG TPA: transporter [Planctomycetaceae bacterium]|nr:transporter [Planctomycetaceae bacterium]